MRTPAMRSVGWSLIPVLLTVAAAADHAGPLLQEAGHLVVRPRPLAVAAGDITGDGLADLAVATAGATAEAGSDRAVTIYESHGTSGLYAADSWRFSDVPRAVTITDVNGDGRPDVLVVSESRGLSVYLNGIIPGQGHSYTKHGPFAGGTSPVALAVADLDGDHHPDVAIANGGSDDLTLLFGQGNGEFRNPVAVAVGGEPSDVVAADLDGDTLPDLAVANRLDGTVSVLYGGGAAYVVDRTVAVPAEPVALTAGVLGDGYPCSLAVACAAGRCITVLHVTGARQLTPGPTLAMTSAAADVLAVDLDGVAPAELLAVSGAGALHVWRRTGAVWSSDQVLPTGAAPLTIAAGLLDGDLYPDVVVAARDADRVDLYTDAPPDANRAPVADAGFDLPAAPGDRVTLDGARSYDPDGDPLSWNWLQTDGPGVTLFSSDTNAPWFTAPDVDVRVVLTFALTVSDGLAASLADTVRVVVLPVGYVDPRDVNLDHAVDATDVQLVINAALGLHTGLDCDVNGDLAIDAADVQESINGALGLP